MKHSIDDFVALSALPLGAGALGVMHGGSVGGLVAFLAGAWLAWRAS